MPDPLIPALLGQDPAALSADVSLATPLTSTPVIGRDAVVTALATYADLFGATDADLRLSGEVLEGAVFTTTIDGETAQLAAVVTRDASGSIATVHLYGRPWPYMGLVRQRLARIAPELTDPEIGDATPRGPGKSWIDHPEIPPLAEDVTLFSPVLTGEPTGKAVVARILQAAGQSFHDPEYRAVLAVEGHAGFAVVMDEVVDGNVLQLVEIFLLDAWGEVDEIRIFTRPWPVTAGLRAGIREHLDGFLGDEFWGDPAHAASGAGR
jgi:hypothetical protein